jgi:hypothetical protein
MKLSPSFVLATAALTLAVGGGAGYAAGSLPHNSVGAAQLRKNAVTAKKIKDDAVTGQKVADGSLAGADLAGDTVTGAQIDESSLSLPLEPGSVLLSGIDFVPRDSASITQNGGSDGSVSGNSGVGTTYVDATVDLPAGAKVTHITMYVVDDGADIVGVFTTVLIPAAGQLDYHSQVLTTGASPAIQALTLPVAQPGPGAVLNLLALLPTGTSYKLYGAKVDYS